MIKTNVAIVKIITLIIIKIHATKSFRFTTNNPMGISRVSGNISRPMRPRTLRNRAKKLEDSPGATCFRLAPNSSMISERPAKMIDQPIKISPPNNIIRESSSHNEIGSIKISKFASP
jgi:hypothetical protein